MSSRRVALAVSAHQAEGTVNQTLHSILRQTNPNFELVVVDDGSTDDTAEVARAATAGDPRVRVVSTPHRGVCAALNLAAAMSTGKYIGWVDSDDALAPTALERTTAFLDANPEVGMVYTQYLVMDAAGELRGLGSRCAIPYSKHRLLTDFMTFHFRLMRRELFERLGGLDEEMRYAEDYDLCLRLSEITPIAHIAEPLYYYRVHDSALSRTHRAEQIAVSRKAVERALARRGLAERLELHVDQDAQFILRERDATSTASLSSKTTNTFAPGAASTSPEAAVDWRYLRPDAPASPLECGLVSCLCVTRGRYADVQRALACFHAQTYRHIELVVVFESLEPSARALLNAAGDRVRHVHVPLEPKQPLGALRNISIAAARGEFVCSWDDDDWHAPQRIETQLRALTKAGVDLCFLGRWIMLDVAAKRAFISSKRTWEGSLLCRRSILVSEAYPALARGEDRVLVEGLLEKHRPALLDCPALYVYRVHGDNTWDPAHFQRLFVAAAELPAERVEQIASITELAAH